MDGGRRVIEAHGCRWPNRDQRVAMAYLLGEDEFGRWLGIKQGDPWWAVDGSRSGVYIAPLVKLVVEGAEPFATVGSGWLRRFMINACGER